jgi:branched-chain amino acid transport system permease protein
VRVQSACGVDLVAAPFASHRRAIANRVRDATPQALGAAMRSAGVELFRYPSARDSKDGVNVAEFTPIVFGSGTRGVFLPIGDEPINIGPASLPPIQVLGAGVAILFFIAFTWFFKKSRMGVAMRAVADNQQVAQAMGINVERYFALAWAMAGVVSALGGIIWGSMLGVDIQLALVGLKVFPVVILGGLDSIGGALVGGLIVGIVESLAAGYLDPYVGGGTKDFAPYVLMILVLMIRPYGIFGRRQIERV